MSAIAAIVSAVEQRVEHSHPQVIAALLDIIEQKFAAPIVPLLSCSYRERLPEYVSAKLLLRRIERDLQEGFAPYGSNDLSRRAFKLGEQIRSYKNEHLYYSPCGTCPTCRSRRKRWPVVFASLKTLKKFAGALQ